MVLAMESLWFLKFLLVLVSADAARSNRDLQGISCVNDFVRNVSCSWSGPPPATGVDCWVSGVKENSIRRNYKRVVKYMIRSCKLEQRGDSPPGCSFVFENKEFNRFKNLPYISLDCNGTLVENITNYNLSNHIKMNPPGVPQVNATVNHTLVSWSAGAPISIFITSFDFHVQIKQKKQTWGEADSLFTRELKQRISSWKLKGNCQVRVRVYPTNWPHSQWSDWSPTTSWLEPTDTLEDSNGPEWLLDQTSLFIGVVMLSFGVLVIMMLVLYSRRISKEAHKEKSVPNPSKYFHTLHSVHGGNLKMWLNPLSDPETFFTVQPSDHFSLVELCERADVASPTSSSSNSTTALTHFKTRPSGSSGTSGFVDHCSSSSFFSNMGYFLSSSSGSSAQTNPSHTFFTDQEEFHHQLNSPNLHLSLWPSISFAPTYESLKKEPQSPDSGFGIGQEDEQDKKAEIFPVREREALSEKQETSPLLILPHHPPFQMSSTSSPPAPTPTQESSGSQRDDDPMEAAGSYTAWPLTGAMSRPVSMPVPAGKTGYLTLKELHTTFRNKSI